ncbi:MAG: hypothetical protein HYY24_10765 [Verrucomicrobia bacterium]|nr:hypothetical protein [Verrucomicrobiota bacterium]
MSRLARAALGVLLLCGAQLDAHADSFFLFSESQLLARENQGTVTLTVQRGSGSAADLGRSVTVSFATVAGTALAGQDFTATSGVLTFGPGEETKTINVPILDNTALADDRSFRVVLANPSEGAQLRWPNEANVLILDNENPGSLDPSFKPSGVSPWSWASISVLATQPDGKIVASGAGFPNSVVARFHPDGTLDWIAPIGGSIAALAVTSDGHVLVGGQFTSVHGVARQNLARLNADGSLDTAFLAEITKVNLPARVAAIAVTRDQRIILGGDFSLIGSTVRTHLARIHADGTVAPEFSGATFTVFSGALVIGAADPLVGPVGGAADIVDFPDFNLGAAEGTERNGEGEIKGVQFSSRSSPLNPAWRIAPCDLRQKSSSNG